MFTEAVFTVARTCKQPKCSSTGGWIKKVWYTYVMEYQPLKKKKKIMPFAATWMGHEIMLSGVGQTEKDGCCVMSLICRV